MDLKFRKQDWPDIRKLAEVPEHLHWILQPGYSAAYLSGKFGKLVTQSRVEGDFDLRIYYAEIWQPMEWYVTTNKTIISAYASYTQDMILRYNDLPQPILIPRNDIMLICIHEYPRYMIVPMNAPGYYVSWHISAPLKYQKDWLKYDYLKKVIERYQPKIDFSLKQKFRLQVPLEE